jgi:hypothetical protein
MSLQFAVYSLQFTVISVVLEIQRININGNKAKKYETALGKWDCDILQQFCGDHDIHGN